MKRDLFAMKRKLKTIFASASLLALGGLGAGAALAAEDAFVAPSGEYETDPKHRYISFSYLHQGLSRPVLRWGDWDATLDWDADNPENSSVAVTIDVNAVDSGVDEFNDHLRSADFFDVANHPEITFVSTGVEQTGEGEGRITGDLTIKGITKAVTLNAVYNASVDDARNNRHKIGFSATTSVKRSDFDVDAYVPFVGDDVDIVIEAEFVKPSGD